jgi:plastocyanin
MFSTEFRATMQCEQRMRISFHPVCRRRETGSQWGVRHPSISNAEDNALFCVTAGTTVTWESTGKNIGFVVDPGTTSPCEPEGAIIGGSDRSVSVVAKTAGCYKYSTGACASGAIYGTCKEISAEVIVTGGK